MASDLGPFGLKSTLTVTAAVSVCIVFISMPCVFIALLSFIKSFVHRRSFYVLLFFKKDYWLCSRRRTVKNPESQTEETGGRETME